MRGARPADAIAGCWGCCACRPPVLLDEPSPAPGPEYLLPDVGDLFRPRDYFVAEVVRARLAESDREHARAQLDAAWRFLEVHGREALVDALAVAAGMSEGLGGPLAALLRELTKESGA